MTWLLFAGLCTLVALVCAFWPRRPLVGAFLGWSAAASAFLVLFNASGGKP